MNSLNLVPAVQRCILLGLFNWKSHINKNVLQKGRRMWAKYLPGIADGTVRQNYISVTPLYRP